MKTSTIEALVWVLVYGGLLLLCLGLFVSRSDGGLGWLLVLAGAALAVAGVVLIYLRFKAVVEHIRRNLTEPITVQKLCELAGMSRSAFYRAFTDQFGMGPNQLVLHERINHAKQLLQRPEVPIKEVCYASGFSDPNYFARLFKKLEGRTPGEFRNAG